MMNSLFYIFFLMNSALANDAAITLQKGEVAPFTGTLISPESAAKLLTDHDQDIKICLAESKLKLDTQKNESDLLFKLKDAELQSCIYRLEANTQLYEKNIDYMQRQAITPAWEKPAWFAGGVLVGVAVFLASTYALDKIGD